MDILSWMPQVAAVISLGVFGFLALWTLIRRYAPVAHGKILGPHEVIGRKADGTCVRFKANLVEVNTHNADNRSGLKRILSVAFDSRIKFLQNEQKKLQQDTAAYKEISVKITSSTEQKKAMEADDDLSKYYRLIVFREGFKKHVLLQHKYVEKSLSEYATPEGNKFTLSFGFQSKGVILGGMSDEKEELNLPKIGDLDLGKFSLHYFVPDVRKDSEEKASEPPEYLKQIALYLPASLELNEELKSKDEQLRDKDRKLIEMGHELSAAATERDGFRLILKKLGIRDPEKLLASKKFDIIDLAVVSVPTIIGYFIVQSMGVIPIVGVFIGLISGAGLVAFFRR